MSAARDEILQFFINKFKHLQLDPQKRSFKSYFILTYMILSHSIQVYFGWMLVMKSNKFLIMATGIKTCIVQFQLVKLVAALRKNDILYLIENIQKFWHSESTEHIYVTTLRGVKAFQYFMWVSFVAIVILPNVFGHLAFDVYLSFPEAHWVHSILQLVQFYYTMEIVIVVDCFFLSLCFFVSGQFRLLHKRLENLGQNKQDEYKVLEDAKACVKHHVFLLEYTQRYSNMFQYGMLLQYCITTASVCVEAVVITKATMIGIAKSVVYLSILMLQLGLHCFPAEIVIQDALETSQAAFNAKWYNQPRLAKTYIAHIIQLAQREFVFSAAGFVDIKRAAFIWILKLSMSFYTLMQNIERLLE